jgi:hypothetical protein
VFVSLDVLGLKKEELHATATSFAERRAAGGADRCGREHVPGDNSASAPHQKIINGAHDMTDQIATPAQDRPIVYIAVEDSVCQAAIVDALHRQGAAVLEFRTGFHLLGALADLIDGAGPSLRPGLVIVDAVLRGCSGMTIAAGLRDLELQIPVVVVATPGEPMLDFDGPIQVVSSTRAASAIAEIARTLSPAHALDEAGLPEHVVAAPRSEGSR